MKRFDSSNYTNRSRKAEGSIKRTVKENDWVCFKLVGAELTGEGLGMLHNNTGSFRQLRSTPNNLRGRGVLWFLSWFFEGTAYYIQSYYNLQVVLLFVHRACHTVAAS